MSSGKFILILIVPDRPCDREGWLIGHSKEFQMESQVDKYIQGFPVEVRKILSDVRSVIRETAPEATEGLKYGIPTFIQGANLVHYAAFKHHIGLYPGPGALEAFREQLSVYKGSKGAVQFPLSGPIPFDLIRAIVKYRLDQLAAKAKKAR